MKEALCIIPVRPLNRLLLAIQRKDQLYLDKVLLFGLRSASLILSAVADAMEWIIRQQGVYSVFHYVDYHCGLPKLTGL